MQKGFTLLELLVVLVIVGMTASFAGPNLWSTYAKGRERNAVQSVASSIQALRLKAFHSGKPVFLPAVPSSEHAPQHWLEPWPQGWQLESATAIQLLPSSVTSGGKIRLRSPAGYQWLLELSPLDGKVSIRRNEAIQ